MKNIQMFQNNTIYKKNKNSDFLCILVFYWRIPRRVHGLTKELTEGTTNQQTHHQKLTADQQINLSPTLLAVSTGLDLLTWQLPQVEITLKPI